MVVASLDGERFAAYHVVVLVVLDVVVEDEVDFVDMGVTLTSGLPRTGLQPGSIWQFAATVFIRPSMEIRKAVESCMVLTCR